MLYYQERGNVMTKDMNYVIHNNQLQATDFIRLFQSVGWGEPPYDLVETSLENSYATFSVTDGDTVIAMARLLGDGGMAFFMKDLVVSPDYQGHGIGAALISHMEAYIASQLKNGWAARFQLMSAKGKEGFYCKMGFTEHPHEHSGAGFTKMIMG